MLKDSKKQKGFTLIEVVAVAALLGVLVTMLMPSLDGANTKVKNSKLTNDLQTIDQAIQLYKMENGKCPENLTALKGDYLVIDRDKDFTDAMGETLNYESSDGEYTLSGKNASGATVYSSGSKKEK